MRLQLEPHFLLKMKKKYTTVKLHKKKRAPSNYDMPPVK